MLKEGRDIRDIAIYVAQRMALRDLTAILQSTEALQRLQTDPHEGFKALIFFDYYISHINDPAARERAIGFLQTSPSLDEIALYASATFAADLLLTELTRNDAVTNIAKPTVETLRTLVMIDYFSARIGRGDIKKLLIRGAGLGKPLDQLVETASLALAGRLTEQRIASLTNEVVIPALKSQLRAEIEGRREYLRREAYNQQQLAFEREQARINFKSKMSSVMTKALGYSAASAAIGAICAAAYWVFWVWGSGEIAVRATVKPPYEAVAEPEKKEVVSKLSSEYRLLSTAFTPDYARQAFLERISALRKKAPDTFLGVFTVPSKEGFDPDELAGLEYVLSQDSAFAGKKQLEYFKGNSYHSSLRLVETLDLKQKVLDEAENSNLQSMISDSDARRAYVTDAVREIMASRGLTHAGIQEVMLMQLQPTIETIIQQQAIYYDTREAIRQQNISLTDKKLPKEKQLIVDSYRESVDAISQNMRAITQSIAGQ